MKKKTLLYSLLIISFFVSAQDDSFPILKGPYLGQTPPGTESEIFAPGIISKKGYNDALFCAYLDGNGLILFTSSAIDAQRGKVYYEIFATEMNNDIWSKPFLTNFHAQPNNDSLLFTHDDNSIYFGSCRSTTGIGESADGFNIWFVKKSENGFSNPRILSSKVNSIKYDIFPSITSNGTLYFFSERDGGFGGADIYYSKFVDGKFQEVENIGQPINTVNSEIDPFIAPDESYLIYCSRSLDGFGEMDLYISYRTDNKNWTEPINLGEGINTPFYDWIPFVSKDGKYFFFTSNRSGDDDIYWVDAHILEQFKPKK